MGNCRKESVLHRINEFREYSAISKSTLAASIGVEQTTLNNQLIGKRGLSLDTTINVLYAFPDISAEWLLRGEGEMLKAVEQDLNNDKLMKLVDTITFLQETINNKNETIALLNEKIKQLENQPK